MIRPQPRARVQTTCRVSFAFCFGGVGSFGLAGAVFLAARSLRLARQAANRAFSFPRQPVGGVCGAAGSGFGYWNTGKVSPIAPARTVRVSPSQQTSAQKGQSSKNTPTANTSSTRISSSLPKNSSTVPSTAKNALMVFPPLPVGARGAALPGWKAQRCAGIHRWSEN